MQNPYSIYSDEELMAFLARGEVKAFDELYGRYAQRLTLYFTRMLGYNKVNAEDALHDLFLKLVQSPERFDSSRSFKTWIYSAAFNQCKNYYRHREVVKRSEDVLGHALEGIREPELGKWLLEIDAQRFRTVLMDVLDSLSPEKKEAFVLRFQEDKKIAEIARIQNCPEGSVKSRLHYTLRILEEKLIDYHPHL